MKYRMIVEVDAPESLVENRRDLGLSYVEDSVQADLEQDCDFITVLVKDIEIVTEDSGNKPDRREDT